MPDLAQELFWDTLIEKEEPKLKPAKPNTYLSPGTYIEQEPTRPINVLGQTEFIHEFQAQWPSQDDWRVRGYLSELRRELEVRMLNVLQNIFGNFVGEPLNNSNVSRIIESVTILDHRMVERLQRLI